MESIDSSISSILDSLGTTLALTPSVIDLAKATFLKAYSKNEDWEDKRLKSFVQASIYLSSLESFFSLNFSKLFDDTSQLHSFMISLKEILKISCFSSQTHATANKLIKQYAISLMNYKKIEELFDKISIKGQYEHISHIFQSIWLFFIIARKKTYNNSEDLSECGCLIISVLDLFISNLPNETFHSLSVSILSYLTTSFRTIPAHVQPFIEKIENLYKDLCSSDTIKLKLKQSLAMPNIVSFNLDLNNLYASLIRIEELDERFIRNSVCNNNLLLTPVTRRTMAVSTTRGKVLNWDGDNSLNMSTRLVEVIKPNPTSFQAETPMTSAIECSFWIKKITEEYSEQAISKLCGENYTEIKTRAEDLKSLIFDFVNRRRLILSQHKSEEILKLYYVSLENLLKIEKNKGNNLSPILSNDKFHRALFACSSETILYAITINCILFEEILCLHNITAFDFWKNINSFISFDIRMPLQIKKHFKDIEERIITRDGWEENSSVALAINRLSSENFGTELNHPSFGQFFKRVLSYSANRITELCACAVLSSPVQEEIWAVFKFFLSEKTEFLISRHIDQVILCSIYGVCKNNKLSVNFKTLLDHHNSLYQADSELFTKVKISDGKTGDVIKFYNEVFIPAVKDFLTKKVAVTTPRISSLNPMSPLRANVQSFHVPQSPFLTPRTKRLWAFGENTNQTLQGINNMLQTTARKLNFDVPIKRPRTDEGDQ